MDEIHDIHIKADVLVYTSKSWKLFWFNNILYFKYNSAENIHNLL